MMSDEDLDFTLGSDDEIDIDLLIQDTIDLERGAQAQRRAHHNELERKRRDQIKDYFTSLKKAVPTLQHKAVASKAQILTQASEYIKYMLFLNNAHLHDIKDFRKQNNRLRRQIKVLENANRAARHVKKQNKRRRGCGDAGCSRDLPQCGGEGSS